MIEATIINGDTLCHNEDFTIELAMLTCGRDEAIGKLLGLADKFGGSLKEKLVGSLDWPSSRQEKRSRALGLVRELGRAVGAELSEKGYAGEHRMHYQAFRQGLLTGKKPEDIVCTAREKLFFECGRMAGIATAASFVRGKKATLREVEDMLRESAKALEEGINTCAG
jgi:hypothetical protein